MFSVVIFREMSAYVTIITHFFPAVQRKKTRFCKKNKKARQKGGPFIPGSYGAGYLPAAQTTGASVGVPGNAVDQNLYALHVRLPCTVGTPVGMADLNTERYSLVTELTLCHLVPHLLPDLNLPNRQLFYITRETLQMQEKLFTFCNFFSTCHSSGFSCRPARKNCCQTAGILL